MENVIKLVLTLALVIVMWHSGYKAGYNAEHPNPLPTQSEVQEIIGVPVDGVIGRESRKAWDAYIERRETDEWITPIMTEFNKEFDKNYLNGIKFED